MREIKSFLKGSEVSSWLNKIQWMKFRDGIGEPPWGGFSVEWSRTIAFWVRELEVTGNPLERLKNAIFYKQWRIV